MSPGLARALLLAAGLLAFALRSLGAPAVFVGDEVFLNIWDGAYHARRALYSFVRFPDILVFDPLLRYPDGAPVPLPPLYDWLLAAVARLFGDSIRTFEVVAAWASPTLAALTVLPVYALGSLIGGRGSGVAAAAIFAVLPASVFHSGVGDPDHHAAVSLLGASYLAVSALCLAARGPRLVACAIALVVVRTALVLSWTGSLLLLGVGESALLLGAVLAGRRTLFLVQALGALGSALLVAPWVIALGTPLGGSFSSTELSWLHGVALLAVAGVAAGMFGLQVAAPTSRFLPQLGRAVLLASGVALLSLAFAPLREALGVGLGFIGKDDSWAGRSAEQVPLFAWLGGLPAWSPDLSLPSYGWFAYAIVGVPLVLLWHARDPERRAAAGLVAWWATALGALAIAQIRFGNEFAPSASVGFALLLDALRRGLAGRIGAGWASACSLALGIALLWPAVSAVHLPALRALDESRGVPAPNGDPALARASTTLVRFAQLVRESTPETSGFFDAVKPEYSVLVRPSHGHVIHYVARRATPINNFGPYLDDEKQSAVLEFYATKSEAKALEIAERFEARYVETFADYALPRDSLALLLHHFDGSKPSGAYSRHFRLVAELPRGAPPHWSAFPRGLPGPLIPYKLFERVAGARLEVEAAPGGRVVAELPLVTNTGRSFVFRARERAGADGAARFVLPYSTEEWGPTRAQGPYRIDTGERSFEAVVSRSAVESGTSIRCRAPEGIDRRLGVQCTPPGIVRGVPAAKPE